ncbi:MAG TPA: cysteine-rich CWC family protein [Rubrivivax sp.]|nr:cysteine-rich CWC family protein [Rubrivivax sp.]
MKATAPPSSGVVSTALDRCPRCGGGFSCGVVGPVPCPCTDVHLSPALQSRLRQQFNGCLCLVCLQALAEAERAAQGASDEDAASA